MRNWRILWRSLTPSLRRETLIRAFKLDLERHKAEPHAALSQWRMRYTILGQTVCETAFCIITKIGHALLTKARDAALQSLQSSLSRRELNYALSIQSVSRDPRYLDVRAYLLAYADSHGEQSPMKSIVPSKCCAPMFSSPHQTT